MRILNILLLPLLLLLGGCVVKQYGSTVSSGAAKQSLAPVDFSATEAELERLIESGKTIKVEKK